MDTLNSQNFRKYITKLYVIVGKITLWEKPLKIEIRNMLISKTFHKVLHYLDFRL